MLSRVAICVPAHNEELVIEETINSLKRLVSIDQIYVVSDDGMKTWQVLARNIVFIPIFPFILLWVLDPLFMFFTKTNQRLSEILSKTKVVEKYDLTGEL